MPVAESLDAVVGRAVELRHQLHQVPELGYEEHETAAIIRSELDRLSLAWEHGPADAPTATMTVIGDPAKPCIALRADIDALPITERTGLPYASRHVGKMHACGHDGHASVLLGVAAALAERVEELPVCVKCFWQPAEEGGGGGKRLVDAGLLDGRWGPKVTAVYGLHGWPNLPVGMVSTRPGPLLAATDTFRITVKGVGCHGAFPHMGADPVVTAAAIVQDVQHIASRDFDPTEPVVVTVGKIHGGTANNVIPDEVTLEGTARTLTPEGRAQVEAALRRRSAAVAEAGRCTVDFAWKRGYPPTVNDPDEAARVVKVVRETLGEGRFILAGRPAMGGEDFAFYVEQVPGCFFLVGTQPEGAEAYPPLHSDRYDFTDAAVATGIRMMLGLVRSYACDT
ncbi:MAG: M20 family metallopeptidase [Phycisphaerae bacterium]